MNKLRFSVTNIFGSVFIKAGWYCSLIRKSTLILTLTIPPVFAQNRLTDDICGTGDCKPHVRGRVMDDSASGKLAIGKNTERETLADTSKIPFSISVDGEILDHNVSPGKKPSLHGGRFSTRPSAKPVDKQRQTDIGLNAVDIQVTYDGLETGTELNISTVPIRRTYRAGEKIRFLATSNYPAFIERSEIRIYENGKQDIEKPVAIIPVRINHEAEWIMPSGDKRDFIYILRVYDSQNRYDETAPLTIARTNKDLPSDTAHPAVAPGMAEDRTAVRNIPIQGGAITISGRNIPSGYSVRSFGEIIPVDPNHKFVVRRILPAGDHTVDIALDNTSGHSGLRFSRDVNIPSNDWFYVGLADLYLGKYTGSPRIQEVRPGEYEEVYKKGRLAFYLKGKIKGEYLLTAAADTTEDKFGDLFRNMDKKDPRRLLRRLDPNEYYPVYGDDSVFVEDAPTQGKFYVRLERGDSHVMWGTHNTRVTGTEFMRSEREIYGANALYRSQDMVPSGERRTEATVYAAQPDTLSQREEFLATGGSAYFMRRQDITRGSETITVETRDEVTGRVIERRTLQYGKDYTFNYMQGVLLLQQPLSSTTGTNTAVRDGALGGQKVYLLVNYEYNPVVSDIDGYLYGGRAQRWLNDNIRVGVTGMSETTGPADQRAAGADIQLRHSEKTVLETEFAHSKGPGFGLLRSTDGGLSWNSRHKAGDRNRAATAWRVRGQVGLEDFIPGDTKGTIGGYYQNKQAGFSSLTEEIAVNQEIWGADAYVDMNEKLGLKLTYDNFQNDDGRIKRDGNSTIIQKLDEYWTVSYGIRYTKLLSPLAIWSGKKGYDGSRLDGGARLEYRWDDDRKTYVFSQGTLNRSGDIDRNDRAGIGGEMKLTDKVGVTGEASYGTHGIGGLASINYNPTADDHYYLGYKLDPDRAFELDRYYHLHGTDMGAIVAGMKRRMSEVAAFYSENNYDMFGRRNSLAQTYGVVYTPDSLWTVNGGLEMGRIRDETVDQSGREPEDFNRYAPSLSVGYKNEEAGITAHARSEVRIENSKFHTRDQNSYVFAGGVGLKTSEDWRMLANINAVLSDSKGHEPSFRDTDYIETSLGYAYRSVSNSRLNGLFRYTWLYDMPGNNQLVGGYRGNYYAPAQRSHIMSADFTYDWVKWLSVGAKYGFRFGEVRYRINRYNDMGTEFEKNWQRSTAHLGIIRTDLHIIKNWDLLLEGRIMHMPQANTTDLGALAAIYRHLGNNFKVGVGYNFGRFSDDLRDQIYNDRGVFLNVIGKL